MQEYSVMFKRKQTLGNNKAATEQIEWAAHCATNEIDKRVFNRCNLTSRLSLRHVWATSDMEGFHLSHDMIKHRLVFRGWIII